MSKTLFYASQYKQFFDKPIKDFVEKYQTFANYIFHPAFNNKNRFTGFFATYTIVPPSKKFEGKQGSIFIEKRNGKFKITGIDIIP